MIPRATYRLQFRREFTFEMASEIVPYLAQLGISHIYASPILAARKGSAHCYDTVDYTRLNEELGGEEGFRKLVDRLKALGMGIIVDIVPNHMAAGQENPWWMDVLVNGRASDYARCFDIDWEPSDPTLQNRILLPVLGAPLAETLARGQITIIRDERNREAMLGYAEHRFPLRPEEREITPENFHGHDSLYALLERQHYRLAWWRTAGDLINWRRFFDINDLVALRMEDDSVFEPVHARVLALYQEGLIDGFRVDHVDGLADPRSYCRKLRARLDDLRPGGYLVVEKILAPGEVLPDDWGVDGTTGYDFMNDAGAVLHDADGALPLAQAWSQISGRTGDFHEEDREARRELLRSKFQGAYRRVTRSFFVSVPNVAQDMTENSFARALMRLLEELRIYRTYATGDNYPSEPAPALASAVERALQRMPANDAAAMQQIVQMFQGQQGDAHLRRNAVQRFNQLAASLAAKAVEDTAFYRYGRLISRNEVGADPVEFALEVKEFHARTRLRLKGATMLATATHDHKRGEDARMRLAVLSELPVEWLGLVEEWYELNTPLRDRHLDRADEYQLYQTLIGAWPPGLDWRDAKGLESFAKRVDGWRIKSLHEAKLHSSWSDPDAAYEEASVHFVHRLLDARLSVAFLRSLTAFLERIAPAAALNSFAQTVLRCTTPGVPDLYQGTEFWDFSLVDPDNRQLVDFEARNSSLAERGEPVTLSENWRIGETKQNLIAQLLTFRSEHAECFRNGDYQPLAASGPRACNILSFLRDTGNDAIAVILPRLCADACIQAGRPMPDPAFWSGTTIPLPGSFHGRTWRSIFDQESVRIEREVGCAEIFRGSPVAILSS